MRNVKWVTVYIVYLFSKQYHFLIASVTNKTYRRKIYLVSKYVYISHLFNKQFKLHMMHLEEEYMYQSITSYALTP